MISVWIGFLDIFDLFGNCMIGCVVLVVCRIVGEGFVEGSYSYVGVVVVVVVYSLDELVMFCGEFGFKKLDVWILVVWILLLLWWRIFVLFVIV